MRRSPLITSGIGVPSLLHITLDDISHGLDSGKLTSTDLVKAYLSRIEEVDHEFRSIIEVNPDALTIAAELDRERQIGGRRGALHGVPIVLKDNIVTADTLDATAGSAVLKGAKPSSEGMVVQKLRKAGAIILGKSNLSEWANLRSLKGGTSGWTPRGGQCLGIYYSNMDAAGSSTGSAVSTALGLFFAGVGTETDGSLLYPAERSNVVAIRPTTGLTARDVIIPFSKRQDTVGPIARTVKDLAVLLSVISGRSEHDERTWDIPTNMTSDFAASCKKISLNGVKLGIPRNTMTGMDEVQSGLLDHTVTVLKEAGAEIFDNTNLLAHDEFSKLPTAAKKMASEAYFKESIGEYLATLSTNPKNLKTLDDIIESIKHDSAEDFPKRDVARMQRAADIDKTSQEFVKVMERDAYFAGEEGVIGSLDRNNLDALVTISPVETAISFAAKAGSPVISVPAGFCPEDTPVKKDKCSGFVEIAPNVPVSVCFYGRRYADEILIRMAYAYEQRTRVQRKTLPYKLPKTEISDVKDQRELSM